MNSVKLKDSLFNGIVLVKKSKSKFRFKSCFISWVYLQKSPLWYWLISIICNNSGHLIPNIDILSSEIVEFFAPFMMRSCELVKSLFLGKFLFLRISTHGFEVSMPSGMSSLLLRCLLFLLDSLLFTLWEFVPDVLVGSHLS